MAPGHTPGLSLSGTSCEELCYKPKNVKCILITEALIEQLYLLGDILAVLVRNLLEFLLLDVPALVIGVVVAGAGDGRPHLVVAAALPPVLAVLLVVSVALCLGVILQLVPGHNDVRNMDSSQHSYILVLGAALLLVLGLALLLVHRVALLPLDWLALAPIQGGALGHPDGLALLGLALHILGVPHCLLLRPALHLGAAAVGRGLERGQGPAPAILRQGGAQAQAEQLQGS